MRRGRLSGRRRVARWSGKLVVALLVALISWLTGAQRVEAGTSALLARGGASAGERATASGAVREVLSRSGWQISKRTFSDREADSVTACLRNDKPWSCIVAVLGDRSLEQLAIVSIDPKRAPDGTAMLVVTARVVVGAQNLAYGDEQFCERCDAEKLRSTTVAVASKVLNRVLLSSSKSSLEVSSTPAGARVTVDGSVLGVTNAAFSVLPGAHVVTLALRGHREVSRRVDVADGEAAKISVILEPEPEAAAHVVASSEAAPRLELDASDSRDTHEARIFPSWVAPAAMGVGVTALIGGIVLMNADADQPVGEPQNKTNVSGRGLALIIGGSVATVAGVYLWRWPPTRKNKPRASSASASVIPLPDGIAASIAGSF